MDKYELAEYNLGENLDQLMNLDPRGYGVCRILYSGAREFTGESLSMHCAKGLKATLKKDDIVYIFTGFVLLPNLHAEMDGIISSMLLCRTLVKAYGAKPVIICPEECMEAARNLAKTVGLHCYTDLQDIQKFPISVGVICFTKDYGEADRQAAEVFDALPPKAAIAIEAPGSNEKRVFHNATGLDMTAYECKSECLFQLCREKGIWNMAIGDLGNEMGMGAIKAHLARYVPYMEENGCICGCKAGSMAATAADNIMTATVSDWAGYALIAATAFINADTELLIDAELEREVIAEASRSGMVDMYGWLEHAIDGIPMEFHINLVNMMKNCVENVLRHENKCDLWFQKVNEKGFFDQYE